MGQEMGTGHEVGVGTGFGGRGLILRLLVHSDPLTFVRYLWAPFHRIPSLERYP